MHAAAAVSAVFLVVVAVAVAILLRNAGEPAPEETVGEPELQTV